MWFIKSEDWVLGLTADIYGYSYVQYLLDKDTVFQILPVHTTTVDLHHTINTINM